MVSTKFLSIRRNTHVERKCSLLGKFVCTTLDREEHERQVRQNLASALCTAQKVKVKVGRDGVTVTDRTIWQHKLDRIPHSLISDAYVDKENPQICYFINKAVPNYYQLSAFLCKSAADARRLVEVYRCNARMIEGYNREITRTYSQDCNQVYLDSRSSFPAQRGDNIHIGLQHSTLEAVACHGNTAGGHQRMNNYALKAGRRNQKMVRVNNDGMSRLMIGGNSPRTSPTYRDKGSLQRVTHNQSPMLTYAHQRSRSSSPVKRSNMVEEEFTFVPTDTYRSHSLPRHTSRRDDYHSQSKRGLNLVKPNEVNNGRRRAPYGSILEYEEAQRNGTISSSGLHTTSSSDNIFSTVTPQMALVTRGDNYMIRDSVWPVQKRWAQRPTWENKSVGLQMVQNGRFPAEKLRPRKSRSAEVKRPTAIHACVGYDKPPLQPGNQLQIYSPENVPQGQPRYKVQKHGKGQNYLKNEALEYDDDHKYFRQHGQRLKKTSDGKQQLFLDKRLAETRDIVGNQLVEGKHSQKVHSGETVGANHRSQFHSEIKTSHKISQPTSGGGGNQSALHPKQSVHRKNSKPVRTITHQWPNPNPFGGPKLHFNENVAAFPTNEPLQRFFKPEYNPGADMRLNPGFERFFADIDNFGQQTNVPRIAGGEGKDSQLILQTKPDNVDLAESETSSIRSSASAYWPPELKFMSTGNESETKSWKFGKPVKKLRRISPDRDRFER